jgi:sugar/nucleoside kinase (ribokinase family)
MNRSLVFEEYKGFAFGCGGRKSVMPDILGLGEISVETVLRVPHLPEPEERLESTSQTRFPSGNTANYLNAISRLGTTAGFVGAVGDDPEGEFLVQSLRDMNIDTKHMLVKKGKQTPVNYDVIDENRQRFLIESPLISTTKLDLRDIKAEYISKSKFLSTTAIHPQLSIRAARISKRSGATVSLDLEGQVAAMGWESLKELVRLTDLMFPLKDVAMELTQTSTVEDAADFSLRKGPSLVVITLGEKGCLVATKKSMKVVPPFKGSVADDKGTEEAFNGGFTIAHMKGLSPEGAAIFADAVAALKGRGMGGRTGMPTLNQVKEFLETSSRNNIQLL